MECITFDNVLRSLYACIVQAKCKWLKSFINLIINYIVLLAVETRLIVQHLLTAYIYIHTYAHTHILYAMQIAITYLKGEYESINAVFNTFMRKLIVVFELFATSSKIICYSMISVF